MRIDHHHHFEVELVERLFKTLQTIIINQGLTMSQIDDLKAALDAEHAAIADNTAAVQAAVNKVDATIAALANAQAGGDSAAVQSLIDQAKADTTALKGNTAALVAVAPVAAPAASASTDTGSGASTAATDTGSASAAASTSTGTGTGTTTTGPAA